MQHPILLCVLSCIDRPLTHDTTLTEAGIAEDKTGLIAPTNATAYVVGHSLQPKRKIGPFIYLQPTHFCLVNPNRERNAVEMCLPLGLLSAV